MTSGHWANSHRRSTLPPYWRRIRHTVLQRDGWQCTWTTNGQRCPATTQLEIHHVGDPHDHRPANLRTLCHDHHARITAQQAHTNRPTRRRPPEPHPGLRTSRDTTNPE